MVKKHKSTPPIESHPGVSVSARPSLNLAIDPQFVDVEETGNFIIIPPDGGWGWVVVLAAFLTFTFTDGFSYCFGLFMEDIAAEMKVSATTVSITSSLLSSLVFLMGPVNCAMINRYGFRLVAVVGAIGSTACVLSSSFAPNILIFITLLGAIGGIFFSMLYISSCVIVGFYFERWRAIATAMSVSGSAMGVVVVPLILGFLQDYNWRQQVRVIGYILIITIAAGLTYRPVAPVMVEKLEQTTSNVQKKLDMLERINSNDPDSGEYDLESRANSRSNWESAQINRLHNLRYPTAADMHGGGSILLSFIAPIEYRGAKSANQSLLSDYNWVGSDVDTHKRCYLDCNCCHKKLARQKTLMYIATRPLYREDIFFQGPLTRLEKYKNAKAAAVDNNTPRQSMTNYHMEVTRMAAYQDFLDQQSQKCLCCPHAVVRILSTMFDMNLLRSCSFTTFMFTGFFTCAGMFVPFIYVTEMNIVAGLGETTSRNLLSVIGFTNILGRIMCGFVSISPKIQAIIVMEVLLIISGISVILMPFFPNVYVQYICGSVYGLTIAVNGALRPVVIVDLYGLENLTNAFGLAMLFQGVAASLGIPIAGVLKDVTGSYHALMIFAGGCITLSGLLIFAVKPLATRENNIEFAKKFHYKMKQRQGF